MIRYLRIMAVPVLAAVVALFAGLAPTLLRTGRVQPLDWLMPGFVAVAVMALVASRGGRRPGWTRLALYLAMSLLPALLLCAFTSTLRPWIAMTVLAVLLSTATALLGWKLARPARQKWTIAVLCLLLLAGVDRVTYVLEGWVIPGVGPEVGVMTALPLFAAGEPGLLDVGGRSPLLKAALLLEKPVDVLDAQSLAAFDHLLLAQPRLLRPEELVALDAWVRAGGHVTILADPLLNWTDGHALGDPRRAPLTSLLDPLLTHWGMTLEPADASRPEERRILAGGQMLQLAGASRFTLATGAPCVLEERALFARCTIGKGKADLVADADWIHDTMWTTDPERPRDRRQWTSDAVLVLAALARGDGLYRPTWPWLKSQDALISALRWAIALILLLGALLTAKGPIPISAHDPPMSKPGGEGGRDSVSPDSVT